MTKHPSVGAWIAEVWRDLIAHLHAASLESNRPPDPIEMPEDGDM
ncbi:hypothetical protein [Croceicoccus sediminis]|nr:hypothetical protein [Croceicoccus sediminis]